MSENIQGNDPRKMLLKGFVDGPEQLIGHVAQRIMFACDRPLRLGGIQSHICKRDPAWLWRAIAYVAQAQRISQMGVQHGHYMAVGIEGARLDIMFVGEICLRFCRR